MTILVLIDVREIGEGESVGYGQAWTSSRPSRLGTVAIGYGDGYPRHAPRGTPVLVNGRRAGLIGRVSMDYLAVDLTGLPDAQVGDVVSLWGDGLAVEEVATLAGTIAYELLTRLGRRVKLRYLD